MRVILEGSEERALMNEALQRSAIEGKVRVLEAGCGQRWGLRPANVTLHITGVDLDAVAIRIRQQRSGDLDEAIVGDLHDVDLPTDAFDVVYCAFVLEHVRGAEQVLDRMVRALRPGGRLILRIPDRNSVWGALSRHTPHRSHIWYKKYVEHTPGAGTPGHAPYPVVYDPVVSADGMDLWVRSRSLTIEDAWGHNTLFRRAGKLVPIVRTVCRALSAASRGALAWQWNDLTFVILKPA